MTAADGRPPLRIAIVVETFAREMGYVSNTLPKFLARQGHHVDLVTSEKMPYWQRGKGESVFDRDFVRRNLNRVGSEEVDGFTVHTLRSVTRAGYPRLQGLGALLERLRPDLICIFVSAGWIALDCARQARRSGCGLVTGSHTGRTYFPLAHPGAQRASAARLRSFLLRELPGRYISGAAHHCVVPTTDCAEIASGFFGVPPEKVRIMNLPVDTDVFHPVDGPQDETARRELRRSLGFTDDQLVCVYSGKFTHDKNPVVLLQAIELLAREGLPVRGLFIGAGEQQDLLEGHDVARVLPFKPFKELGAFFRAADVGVWMEETISFLDAACSGLPLVLGSTVSDISHVREFTTVYPTNDAAGLADALRPLLDPNRRLTIGRTAARLARERFSADQYTRQRIAFFREALSQHAAKGAG